MLIETQSARYKGRFCVSCGRARSDLSYKLRGVILKQSVKGAQHSTTFIVGRQAVTKQLLLENGTHRCATRAHGMCFARRVMVLPPTSGRLTPEFIDVHLKERD